jgi:hypothetical protein
MGHIYIVYKKKKFFFPKATPLHKKNIFLKTQKNLDSLVSKDSHKRTGKVLAPRQKRAPFTAPACRDFITNKRSAKNKSKAVPRPRAQQFPKVRA